MASGKNWFRPLYVFCTMWFVSSVNAGTLAPDHQLEPRNFQVNRIGLDQGLSQVKINAITQDSQGYLWFGTQEGLNRFDGKRIRAFYHSTDIDTSLSSDWISDLMVDQSGQMWVATKAGLDVYHPLTESFTRYRNKGPNATSLFDDGVSTVYQDGEGFIWIGSEDGGISRLDPRNRTIEKYELPIQEGRGGKRSSIQINDFAEDSFGRLWVATELHGVFLLADDGKFSLHEGDHGQQVRDLYLDPRGILWLASFEEGLARFNPTAGRFEKQVLQPSNQSEKTISSVRKIVMNESGSYWVATDRGLLEWAGNGGFIRYSHDKSDPKSLSADPVMTLYQDTQNNLWIGTYTGINKWASASDAVRYLDVRSGLIGSDLISALAVARDGTRWIGVYADGLAAIDQDRNVRSYYKHDPGQPGSLTDNRVMAVVQGLDGTIWVGTRSGGLNELPPESDTFITHAADKKDPTKLASPAIASLLEDSDGSLWVGTYGGGLHRYVDGVFERFQVDPADPTSISSNLVVSLMQDRSGRLWVGTEEGGLNRFDYGTNSFKRYYSPDAELSFPSSSAWHINQTTDGSLWVSTSEHGLIQWDADDLRNGLEQFKVFTKAEGLVSNTVNATIEDNLGRLWLSSNRGLSVFDPESGATRHYDHRFGLRSNEFHQGLVAKQEDGRLAFGSNVGVVLLDPTHLQIEETERPPIALEVSTHKGVVHRAFSNLKAGNLKLVYPDNYLSFEFSVLDFATVDTANFRVKLLGFDEDWLNPGEYPRITYTNLPAGEYQFEARTVDQKGVLSSNAAVVSINVVPPPWESNTAKLSYAILLITVLLVLFSLSRHRSRQARELKVTLEQQVEERTYALAHKNEELESLNEKLREASLRDPLTDLRNRRFFYETIDTHIAQVDRIYAEGLPITEPSQFFMMIDLDGFKSINDEFGHQAGDVTLQQLANLLKSTCRQSETVCRWGGDEFMVTGYLENRGDAEHLAERIRSGIAGMRFDLGNGRVGRLTVSIGVTHYPFASEDASSSSWEQVADLADRMAYLAKTSGKNRWVRILGSKPADLSVLPNDDESVMELARQQKCEIYSSAEGVLVAA